MGTLIKRHTLGNTLTPGVDKVIAVEVHDGTDGKPLYSNSEWSEVSRIGTTKIAVYAHIPDQQQGRGSALVASIAAGSGDRIGQVFKASHDNLVNFHFTAGISLAGAPLIFAGSDDFESYANTAAMQVVWVPTNVLWTSLSLAGLSGTGKSLYHDNLDTNNRVIRSTRSLASVPLAGYSALEFWYKTNARNPDVNTAVTIEIVTNLGVHRATITPNSSGDEYSVVLPFTAFSGALNPLTATVTSITIETNSGDSKLYYWIDELRFSANPGNLQVEIYDMGAVKPVNGATLPAPDTFDAGATALLPLNTETTRYLDIPGIHKGLRWDTPFPRTRANLLTAGNYYLVLFSAPDLPAGQVDFYGSGDSNLYSDGFAVSVPNLATTITELVDKDLEFICGHDSTVLVVQMAGRLDAPLGIKAEVFIAVEDKSTETYTAQISHSQPLSDNDTGVRFSPGPKGLVKPVGHPVELYLQPDARDDVSEGTFAITYVDLA